jgi:hypothetical protein
VIRRDWNRKVRKIKKEAVRKGKTTIFLIF